MAQLTFRDFAGAIMGGDTARAAEVLGVLLGLEGVAATAAATHFQSSMTADPAFMQKAMGLRTAVTGGSDDEIATLLGDCFGLTGAAVPAAVATLRKQYPAA
jgi:drug/metabolite transporter (DMT)-like permease